MLATARHSVLLRAEVKSYITSPIASLASARQISRKIAGRRLFRAMGGSKKVLVSADGGKSWGKRRSMSRGYPKAFTRFNMAWRWTADRLSCKAGPGTGGNGDAADPGAVRSSADRRRSCRRCSASTATTSTPSPVGGRSKGEVRHVHAWCGIAA